MIKTICLISCFTFFYFNCFSQDAILKRAKREFDAQKPDSAKLKQVGFNRILNLDVNAISQLKAKFNDIKGEGITICQKEDLPDIQNINLLNKIIITPTSSSITSDHATRMATIMVGSGFTNPFNQGIATESKLISTNFTTFIPEPLPFYTDHHITVVNNSYGSGIENFYGSEAVAYDVFCKNQPDILPIFSSGNVGYLANPNGKYKDIVGYANLSGNYKTAKNVLTVGAIDEYNKLLPSSSRGPTFDGRIKPEVVAYSDEGTSAATAIVSGTAALMQQAYKKQNGRNASSALIKSILINSAEDVGKKGIDFETGYGNVNAYKAVSTIVDKRFIESTVTDGGFVEVDITIPASSKNLKVSLVWIDLEGILNTSKSLVNDLDLEVISNQKTFKPWVLNSYPNIDSLSQSASRREDHVNNMEQVSIGGDLSSIYKIRIKGTHVTTSAQSYFIAYQWDKKESFEWKSPVSGSKAYAGEPYILRWDVSDAITDGKIQISINNQEWKFISDTTTLNLGYAELKLPDIPGEARVKLITNKNEYISDRFTISPKLRAITTFFCKDSVGLTWESTNEETINSYNVFKFDRSSSTWNLAKITDKKNIILKDADNSTYYAVSARSKTDQESIKSVALSAKDDDVSCFYKRLFVDVINGTPLISLELSAAENIQSITFQKLRSNEIKNLNYQPLDLTNTNYYTTVDSFPDEGMNSYRAQITLINGEHVVTDYVSVDVFKAKRFTLFPVPVTMGEDTTIIADKYGEYQLILMDLQGKIIHRYSFTGSDFRLPTSSLIKGMYIYQINENFKMVQSGKIVVQ